MDKETIDYIDNSHEKNENGKMPSNVSWVETLHVMPINKGLSDGVYRFFGICATKNLAKVRNYLAKAREKSITDDEISELALSIYTNSISGVDMCNDLQGKSLLYPINNDAFKLIKSNGIGEIFDAKLESIRKKLKITDSEPLTVIYVDPEMNEYCFDVKPFKN